MKYSENLVKKTMKAIEDNPIHTFWKIHKHSQCDGLEFCGIRFENADSVTMELNICGTEVNALVFTDASRNGFKWMCSCNLKAVNNDSYMMWLGYALDKMCSFASTVDIFSESEETPAPPLTDEELEAVEALKENGTLYSGNDVEPW